MIPRLVVAGTRSGTGKTTVATGLMAAFSARGVKTAGFKVGPDFIDPSYHALACGRPGRNLDAFMAGPELVAPLFRHGSAGAELAVVEGVMGLFDGAAGREDLASTAQVAKLLGAPVLLVVDAASSGRSLAALVHGFDRFDSELRLGGVILNRVSSRRHEEIGREAIEAIGIPVYGALPRDAGISAPERHLGLVPTSERGRQARESIAHLAGAIERHCDLDGLSRLAASAQPAAGPAWSPRVAPAEQDVRVAVARGPAFSFHYQENLELLETAGAELVEFDPLADERLPAGATAAILAGGFPEVYGEELSANDGLRTSIAAFSRAGGVVLAECGGLLYLAQELDGRPMCGVLPARARMADRLVLGYREAVATTPHPAWPAGVAVRGHEFHYSRLEPDAGAAPAWSFGERREGFVNGAIHASYLHTHWAATPEVATRLVAAARRSAAGGLEAPA